MKSKVAFATLATISLLAVQTTYAADESCDKPKKAEESEGCKIPKGGYSLPANFLKKKQVSKQQPSATRKPPAKALKS